MHKLLQLSLVKTIQMFQGVIACYSCYAQAGKGGELTHDETTIISGALDLTEKVNNVT